MAETKQDSVIFVELDTILDTRLATLFEFGDEVAKHNLLNGYHGRLMDVFKGVSESQYVEKYKNRNKSYLKNAIGTPILYFIKDFIKKTHQNSINSPFQLTPKIVINSYPYVLTDDEAEVIIKSVRDVTLGYADIQMVHMTHEEITPQYVRENLSILVIYEFHQWLEMHCANGNFKKTSCPEVGLIGPRVLFKRPPAGYKIEQDPFEAFETLAEPFIRLALFPAEHFSSLIRQKTNET